jgi:CoA:oxalate CoA-transferase
MKGASAGGGRAGLAPSRPLAGVRVLAVEGFIAGPYASMWLADMGAEVIKIEEPGVGDPARALPPIRHVGGRAHSLSLLRANRNKKSVTLDLKHPQGLALFDKLVASSDVVIENLRPDAFDKLGLTYERMAAINPRLIYTSVSGFGHRDLLPGPFTDLPAFDVIAQAMAGLMGRPEGAEQHPVYVGFPLADLYASTVAVCGTLQALFHRTVTGVGQRVDIAMYDAALVLNELALVMEHATGVVAKPGLHALTAPFGSFRSREGFIAIAVLGERVWHKFCAAIGREDLLADPALGNGVDRHRHSARLREIIEAWLQARPDAEAVRQLVAFGVPAARVQQVAQIPDCPQVHARQMVLDLEDEAWGTVKVVGQPIKASGAPPVEVRPPPALGEHSREILQALAGVDEQHFERLAREGVV